MLKTVASFALGKGISLKIARGSVLDFAAPSSSAVGAIVNAANEGCIGGGGVDGAINDAGGPNLWKDREALPILEGTIDVRCETGDAVITGPGDYGDLKVPYVVHAVGPAYFRFHDVRMEGREDEPFAVPDSLLVSAYEMSLERCKEHGVTDVGFSLLSAGVFRGQQSMPNVLAVGIMGIKSWVESSTDTGKLETVTLCGFSEKEAFLLLKVSTAILGESALEKLPSDETNEDEKGDEKKKSPEKVSRVVAEASTTDDGASAKDEGAPQALTDDTTERDDVENSTEEKDDETCSASKEG